MDQNSVCILGSITASPAFHHSLFGEDFYQFQMAVRRQSGVFDCLPITVSCRTPLPRVKEGERLLVRGQFRSYNKQADGRNRLVLTVFAREILLPDPNEEDCNQLLLTGHICKPPTYRTTPFSREITDVLLAVNRSFNKSDYIPCIAWGANARFASTLEVGERVEISGRIQSREYQKQLPAGPVIRVAYEVSAASLKRLITT